MYMVTASSRYGREHIDEKDARFGKDEIRMLLFRDVSSVLTRSTSGNIGAKAVENDAVPTRGSKGSTRGIPSPSPSTATTTPVRDTITTRVTARVIGLVITCIRGAMTHPSAMLLPLAVAVVHCASVRQNKISIKRYNLQIVQIYITFIFRATKDEIYKY